MSWLSEALKGRRGDKPKRELTREFLRRTWGTETGEDLTDAVDRRLAERAAEEEAISRRRAEYEERDRR